jgi:hypothetical protein
LIRADLKADLQFLLLVLLLPRTRRVEPGLKGPM